jgi:hypothetical protein
MSAVRSAEDDRYTMPPPIPTLKAMVAVTVLSYEPPRSDPDPVTVPAVPLRWTALRSKVVEEAFESARYDERGRPQRPAVSACSTP